MEISSAMCLSALAMEDPAFNYQNQIDNLDYLFDDELNNLPYFSSNNSSFWPDDRSLISPRTTHDFNFASSIDRTPQTGIERPAKQPKTDSWNSHNASPSSLSHIISFGNSNDSPSVFPQQQFYGALDSSAKPKNEVWSDENMHYTSIEDLYGSTSANTGKHGTKRARSITRSPLLSQDHVIAERKRREVLSQRFIALSAVVPGLKKMDKASVLEDTIKYVKHLQERVKTLEEQVAKKTMKSAVLVKKSQVYADDESSSVEENSDDCRGHPLPEIEVRVSDTYVLVRIHCEKQKGCLLKTLGEMEKLHLNVLNSSVLPFGNSTLDVTVVAQMDAGFSMTGKDLVRHLREGLMTVM